MTLPTDYTGRAFGRLTVLERSESDRHGNAQWSCQCDCGRVKVIRGSHLKSGRVVSCGVCAQAMPVRQSAKEIVNYTISIHTWTVELTKMSRVCCIVIHDANGAYVLHLPVVHRQGNGKGEPPGACRAMNILQGHGIAKPRGNRSFREWCIETGAVVKVIGYGDRAELDEVHARACDERDASRRAGTLIYDMLYPSKLDTAQP